MCILPSRLEFDEIEARERRFESDFINRVELMTEIEMEEKKKKIDKMLRASIMRFAGAMIVADTH